MSTAAKQGFALPMALWALVLAGGLAGHALDVSRHSAVEAVSAESRALAAGRVEAAVAVAMHRIATAASSGEVPPAQFACYIGGASIAIRIVDEAGKLDLNRVSPGTMAMLFGQLGHGAPDKFAAAVADFRDSDDLRRLNGAEAGDYARLGLRRLPRNGPLLALTDLRAIPGGATIDLDELARHATVAGAASVDPSIATPLVLEIVRARVPDGRAFAASPRQSFALTAETELREGLVLRHSVLIRKGTGVGGITDVLHQQTSVHSGKAVNRLAHSNC